MDDNNYISYLKPFSSNLAKFPNMAADDPSLGETALCTNEPWKCLILNGDFRKEYEEVLDQGYDACYKLYESKKAEFGSSWSD